MMSKQNKYYTPEIEEFHVGFEFERTYSEPYNSEWHKCTAVGIDLTSRHPNYLTLKDIHNTYQPSIVSVKNVFRVKYLDREDIESLGWSSYIDGKEPTKMSGSVLFSIGPFFRLEWNPSTRKILVMVINDTLTPTVKFHGTIKNKSELKRILKMLGV